MAYGPGDWVYVALFLALTIGVWVVVFLGEVFVRPRWKRRRKG